MRSARCTHTIVTQVHIPTHTVGAPHPIPYAMSSVVKYMAAIRPAPTRIAGIDQNHNNCRSNALNLGDALYLSSAAFRYFLPPLPSTAHISSMTQNVKGGHTEFLTWELSLKYISLHPRCAAQPFITNMTPMLIMPTGIGKARALTEG